MNDKFSSLVDYFKEEVGANLRVNPEQGVLDSWLQTEYGGIHMIVQAIDDSYTHLVFSARSLLSVPITHRQECTELLNMINWKLIFGNFEMDPSDGELTFRATYCLCDSGMSLEQFKHGFNNCMLTALHNYPLFQKLIWTNTTAEKIFEESLSDESGDQYVSAADMDVDSIPENYSEEVIRDLGESLKEGFGNSESTK